MKLKLGINSKILLYILGTSIIVFIATIGYLSYKFRIMAFNDAKTLTNAYAREYANYTKIKLSEYMDATRMLGQASEILDNIEEKDRRTYFNSFLIKALEENKEFISSWSTWESYTIDSLDDQYKNTPGSTVIGNYTALYYWLDGKIVMDSTIEAIADSVFTGPYFTLPKKKLIDVVMDPYKYSYSKDGKNEILETSMIVPIMKNHRFMGVVGLDVTLETFTKITDKIKPFKDSYAFIIANNGSFVTHPRKIYINKIFSEIYPDLDAKNNVIKNIQNGKEFSFIADIDKFGDENYFSFAPITIGNSDTPWSLGIVAPLSNIYEEAHNKFLYGALYAFISVIILAIVSYLISRSITTPLEKIDILLTKLNKADVCEIQQIAKKHNDEIGAIAKSTYTLINWINKTGNFATRLKEDELDATYKILNEDDELGKSLLELRDRLILAKEEENKRQIESSQRNWATEGLAKFGEIARAHSDDMKKFSFEIIANIVRYLEANQGGIFVFNVDEFGDNYLELTATFAYDRKKMLDKKIYPGEGLIGSCALEKKLVHLKKIPDDYINIVSGLGDANPSNLLIIPLLHNEEIFGVMEIASFKEFHDFQVSFVEDVTEIIASTINNVKYAAQTNKLLEESKYNSEQLAQQEEEMRQNYEELQTTQEELVRTKAITENKIKDVIAILDGITCGVVTTDISGTILDYNPAISELTGYEKKELDNQPMQFIFKDIYPDNQLDQKVKAQIITKSNKSIDVEVEIKKIQKSDMMNYLYIVSTIK